MKNGRITIRISERDRDMLKDLCKDYDMTLSEVVRMLTYHCWLYNHNGKDVTPWFPIVPVKGE